MSSAFALLAIDIAREGWAVSPTSACHKYSVTQRNLWCCIACCTGTNSIAVTQLQLQYLAQHSHATHKGARGSLHVALEQTGSSCRDSTRSLCQDLNTPHRMAVVSVQVAMPASCGVAYCTTSPACRATLQPGTTCSRSFTE
jgi:hypothetical protein